MTDHPIERDERGRFAPGQSGNLRHGGEAAVKALQHGQPFDGLALESYEGVLGELGIDLDKLTGIDRVLLQRAARLEAAARLFDVAGLAAAASGDLDRWERMQQRMGWIGGKSAAQFEKLRDLSGNGTTLEGLLSEPVEAGSDVSD